MYGQSPPRQPRQEQSRTSVFPSSSLPPRDKSSTLHRRGLHSSWGAARQKIFATAYLPIIIVAIDHQYYINAVLINTPKYKKCLDSSYGECQRQQHVVPSRLSSPRLLDPTRLPTPPLSSLIHKRRHVVPSYCVRSRTSVTTIIKIRARSRAS